MPRRRLQPDCKCSPVAIAAAIAAGILVILLLVCIVFTCLMHDSDDDDVKKRAIEKSTSFPHPLPIYIISLQRHQEQRLAPMLSRIADDPRYRIRKVAAVDGRLATAEAFHTNTSQMGEHYLNFGQIGCWLSHASMWHEVVSNKDQVALILEDDAYLNLPETFPAISAVYRELPSNWHVCYLGGRYANVEAVRNVSPLLEMSTESQMWHSHAYLVSSEGARLLLEKSSGFRGISQGQAKMSAFSDVLPVDDWMTHPQRGLNTFRVKTEIIPFRGDGISDTKS